MQLTHGGYWMDLRNFRKKIRNISLPIVDWFDGGVTLSGRSIPQDADEFYLPLIKKLQAVTKGRKDFVFNFKIEYYNTSSSLYMTKILYVLRNLAKHAKVTINWYYLPVDEQIYELGLDYKEVTKMNINLIELKDGSK